MMKPAQNPTENPTESATESATAEYIPFDEFRNGLPHGRFRVIVNPDLARPFVAYRLHATPVVLAIIGPGIACALAGYPIAGGLLVLGGLLVRRTVKHQAAKILLHLATRQRSIYDEATANGAMEVRRA